MNTPKPEKAPTWHGDAFSTIETALLRGAIDAKAEIDRRFPRGKAPTYAKRWRELARLVQKQLAYDQALVAVDRLRQPPESVRETPAVFVERRAVVPDGGGKVGRHEYAPATAV
jgi:hypothetical protein